MNKKNFSKKYVNVKRKFIKINNYFFNKISLCSVLDLTAIDLVMGLKKFQLDRDNVVLISRYSKKFKVKSDLLRNLVCFSRFRTFFVLFASHISLKKFLDNNKMFNSFFLHKSSGLIFFNDYKTFVTFNQSEFQLNSLFNCFFFSYLTFLLYFFIYNLTNYTWNRNNID